MRHLVVSIEQACAIAYEAYRAYSRFVLREENIPAWEYAPQAERDRLRVVVIETATRWWQPRDIHAAWLITHTNQGWRYGPEKDPLQKEHPSIRPWDELTPAQQHQDILFHAIVGSLTRDPDARARSY